MTRDLAAELAELRRRVDDLERRSATEKDHEILGIRATEQVVGLDRSSVFRLVKRGEFPQPTYIRSRRTWSRAALVAWVAAQAARPASARRSGANLRRGAATATSPEQTP